MLCGKVPEDLTDHVARQPPKVVPLHTRRLLHKHGVEHPLGRVHPGQTQASQLPAHLAEREERLRVRVLHDVPQLVRAQQVHHRGARSWYRYSWDVRHKEKVSYTFGTLGVIEKLFDGWQGERNRNQSSRSIQIYNIQYMKNYIFYAFFSYFYGPFGPNPLHYIRCFCGARLPDEIDGKGKMKCFFLRV